MGTVQGKHMAQLVARYHDATRLSLASGAALITVPCVALPPGWNAATTSIRFIEPLLYPFAALDCFWADGGLRLANGQNPQSSTFHQTIPETQQNGLWFSWHVGQRWNANSDSYLTWMGCIGERLRRPL